MNKSIVRLLLLLVVLGIVAYLVMLRPGEQSTEAAAGEALVAVDSASIQKVEIVSNNGSVTLEKRGLDWRVVSPVDDEADKNNVGQLLQRASSMRVKSIVSTKAEKHAIFSVDSSGTRVTVTQTDKEPVTFFVGKNSSSFGETYVRLDGSDEVALVDGSFPWVFNKPLREWRDRVILRHAREMIEEVVYQYGDTTFTLAFQDSVWQVGGSDANQSVVNSLITTLSSLQCDDFLASVPTQPIMAQVRVAGDQLSFAYDAAAKKYYVQVSTSPQWYIMEPWRADQVLKRRKALL